MKIEPQKQRREAYVTFEFNGEEYVVGIVKKSFRKGKNLFAKKQLFMNSTIKDYFKLEF